jgi:hypothetical protein
MRCSIVRRIVFAAFFAVSCVSGRSLPGQSDSGTAAQGASGPLAVANLPNAAQNAAQPQAAEHPLAGALRMAQGVMDNINQNVQDYTCIMIKRERIDGKLNEPEYMAVKIRNQSAARGVPFSVYLSFLKPEEAAGREVIYVEGQNNGKLIAHEGKGLRAKFGKVELLPTSALAMEGNRYPITQIGISNLTRRLLEVGTHDMQFGECTVNYRKNAKVNNRSCTIIEVMHPVPRRNFLFHKAVIYLDDELNVPIRYEAYSWPKTPGGPPELDEEYTYLNLKLNVGLTKADFDWTNPNYRFR